MEPALAAAIAAAAIGLLALARTFVLGRRLRALREAQSVVLGEDGGRDVVEHASELEGRLAGLATALEETGARLDERDERLEERLDGAVSHFAVVRYDAMGEMTGRQSSSVALLDSRRNGVVLSSILHREHARLYAKQIVAGSSELDLSPEEQEAVDSALGERRG